MSRLVSFEPAVRRRFRVISTAFEPGAYVGQDGQVYPYVDRRARAMDERGWVWVLSWPAPAQGRPACALEDARPSDEVELALSWMYEDSDGVRHAYAQ